jgi:hypothetical protein
MSSRLLSLALFAAACSSSTLSPQPPGDAGAADLAVPTLPDAASDAPPSTAVDAALDLAAADAGPDGATRPEELCRATGGTPGMALCCQATAPFPSTCSVGACGCAPMSSHMIAVCSCPAGGCFTPDRGCVMRGCTPGADHTCNDNPIISSLRGRCLPDGTCACNAGATLNLETGRCR